MKRSVYVQLTIEVDNEEFTLPTDGEINGEIEDLFTELLYDFEGISMKHIDVSEEIE